MYNEATELLFELQDLKGLWNLHDIVSKQRNVELVNKIEKFIVILSPKN